MFSLAKSTKRSLKNLRGARLFCSAGEGLILSQSGWHTKPAGAGCFFNADERFIISQSSVLSSTQGYAGRGYFYVVMFQQINSGHKIGALFGPTKNKMN